MKDQAAGQGAPFFRTLPPCSAKGPQREKEAASAQSPIPPRSIGNLVFTLTVVVTFTAGIMLNSIRALFSPQTQADVGARAMEANYQPDPHR